MGQGKHGKHGKPTRIPKRTPTGRSLGLIDAQIPGPALHDGAFDLLGLFAVVDAKARSIGAKIR